MTLERVCGPYGHGLYGPNWCVELRHEVIEETPLQPLGEAGRSGIRLLIRVLQLSSSVFRGTAGRLRILKA